MRQFIKSGTFPLLVLIALWGCGDDGGTPTDPGDNNPPPQETIVTCIDCHSSEDELKASLAATPSPPKVAASSNGDG
jgi:hypothetical protein